ncbi:MAG: endonuclease/exonuclease/phosphatase family protein [Candidatus Omnitrophica bacterium]|nr:endonuclease/exonuclease/phosphatase family protein [Candidatus Omnitrophota bacterium]
MKILTLNTWQERGPWRERWELIFKGLREYGVDIVGFQEVFNMDWAAEVRKRSGYPYLAVSGQHSGLIFLSKFKLVEQICHIMHTQSPTEDYLRYAFYVRVDAGKEPIALFNTHLSWRADEHDIRMKQTQELVAFVRSKAGDLSCAITGDFNTAPHTMPIGFLRETERWVDTFAEANPGKPGLTWDYRNPYALAEKEKMAERRIDYIFIREKTGAFSKIRSSKVVFDQPSADGIFPSDHFGVLTEF